MKSLSIFIFLFITFSSTAFGQKISFLDTTNIWLVTHVILSGLPQDFYLNTFPENVEHDTVINAMHYRKLFTGHGMSVVREDTIQKKVFIKAIDISAFEGDTSEMVLYDYNLVVGDTVTRSFLYHYSKFYVVHVDSILLNGHHYKVWQMLADLNQSNTATPAYHVIEGIGSTCGPAFPAYPFTFEDRWILDCFHNIMQQPAINPPIDYFNNTTSCTLAISGGEKNDQKIMIYPNPAAHSSQIQLTLTISHGTLKVYDIVGRVVYNTPVNNKLSIPIGQYLSTPGQYFYHITDTDKNQSYTGKFIFE